MSQFKLLCYLSAKPTTIYLLQERWAFSLLKSSYNGASLSLCFVFLKRLLSYCSYQNYCFVSYVLSVGIEVIFKGKNSIFRGCWKGYISADLDLTKPCLGLFSPFSTNIFKGSPKRGKCARKDIRVFQRVIQL